MVMGAPTVEVAKNYVNGLNKGSKTAISPADPQYHLTGGNTNMSTALKRQGPAIYAHIMRAAFDPVYGRDHSIAQQEFEKPQTGVPLAEERMPHERSEYRHAPESLIEVIKRPPEFNPPSETQPANTAGNKKDKSKPYEAYHEGYCRKNYKPASYRPDKEKDEGKGLYKLASMVKALERKAKGYLRSRYNALRENEDSGQSEPKLYEGIAAKVSYLSKKAVSYVGKKVGYGQEQKSEVPLNPQSYMSLYVGSDERRRRRKPIDYMDEDAYDFTSMPTLGEFDEMVRRELIPQDTNQRQQSLEERVRTLVN